MPSAREPGEEHGPDGGEQPVILLAEADEDRRREVSAILATRYGADYRILAAASSDEALTHCDDLRAGGRRLALAIAGVSLVPLGGLEVMGPIRERCPDARTLVVGSFEDSVEDPEALRELYLESDFDLAAPYPAFRADEQFHQLVTELLADHAREHGLVWEPVKVVGERWTARSHELRDLLTRNLVPFGFYEADSEDGRRLLAAAGVNDARLPVLITPTQVLVDPSPRERHGPWAVALHWSKLPSTW